MKELFLLFVTSCYVWQLIRYDISKKKLNDRVTEFKSALVDIKGIIPNNFIYISMILLSLVVFIINYFAVTISIDIIGGMLIDYKDYIINILVIFFIADIVKHSIVLRNNNMINILMKYEVYYHLLKISGLFLLYFYASLHILF